MSSDGDRDTTGEPQPGYVLPEEHRDYLDLIEGDYNWSVLRIQALAEDFSISYREAEKSYAIWSEL